MHEPPHPTGELDQLITRARANLGTAFPHRVDPPGRSDQDALRPVAWTEWVEWIQWIEWVQR